MSDTTIDQNQTDTLDRQVGDLLRQAESGVEAAEPAPAAESAGSLDRAVEDLINAESSAPAAPAGSLTEDLASLTESLMGEPAEPQAQAQAPESAPEPAPEPVAEQAPADAAPDAEASAAQAPTPSTAKVPWPGSEQAQPEQTQPQAPQAEEQPAAPAVAAVAAAAATGAAVAASAQAAATTRTEPAPQPASPPPPQAGAEAKAQPAPAQAEPKPEKGASGKVLAALTPLLAPVVALANKPLANKPASVRDSVGWLALWTLFCSGGVWMYALFIHAPALPEAHEPGPTITHNDAEAAVKKAQAQERALARAKEAQAHQGASKKDDEQAPAKNADAGGHH